MNQVSARRVCGYLAEVMRISRNEELVAANLVGSGLHTVFRCTTDGRATYAVKWLTQRPELPGWRARFERAYAVERWLTESGFRFLPEPHVGEHGPIIVLIGADGTEEWFLVHSWVPSDDMSGRPLATGEWEHLGKVIAAVALTPRSLVEPSLLGPADDPVPCPDEIATRLPRRVEWTPVRDVLACSAGTVCDVLQTERVSWRRVVGHRDLSEANVVRRGDELALAIVDWENCGLSSVEHEIGRVAIAMMKDERADVGSSAQALLRGVRYAMPDLGLEVTMGWYASWLEGHLMFMGHCARNIGNRALEDKLRRDATTLGAFCKRADETLSALRAASAS